MATATKVEKAHTEIVTIWQCSDCEVTFTYNYGSPVYCPDCGEEFESIETSNDVRAT